MTNKEFYGDKLLAVALEKNCYALYEMVHGEECTVVSCRDCEFWAMKEGEYEQILQWLNAEHEEPEPPLLKNGYGLKPGDWIMVKDKEEEPDEWAKRAFVCFYGGVFWTIANGYGFERFLGNHLIMSWDQARLPMEGE